jgi:hypothetical protein
MKKKLLFVFTSVFAVTYAALIAADADLVKGYDFTGSTSVTAAKLNQLVDNAYPGTNRGMIIYTTGLTATNVAAEPKLARYLWLDSGSTPPVPKVWNTNGFWTNVTAIASIADSSVTTSKIANGAVNSDKLASAAVIADRIAADAVTTAKILDGNVIGSKIATGTITTTNIADGTIASADIAPAAIVASLLAANSVGTSNLQSGFALQGTNIASGTITSTNVAQGGIIPTNLAASPTALYTPRVNGATTGFEWAAPGLIQMVSTSRTDVVTCNTAFELGTGIPVNTDGDQVFSLAITPKSSASKLVITFMGVGGVNNNVNINAGLFQDSTVNAIAASTTYNQASAHPVNVGLRHVMTSGTTSQITFKLRVGTAAAATAYINADGSGTIVFGGVAASTFTIEEIL